MIGIGLLIAVTVTVTLIWKILPLVENDLGHYGGIALAVAIPLPIIFRAVRLLGSHFKHIQGSQIFRSISVLDKIVWPIAVLVGTIVIGPYIYDLLRPHLPFLARENTIP